MSAAMAEVELAAEQSAAEAKRLRVQLHESKQQLAAAQAFHPPPPPAAFIGRREWAGVGSG